LLFYAALSAAAAMVIPDRLPMGVAGAPATWGIAIGVALFLAAALLHEVIARTSAQRSAAKQLLALQSTTATLRDEVRRLRDIQRSHEVAPDNSAEIEAMAGEMSLLKSLVDQLHAGQVTAAEPVGFHRRNAPYRPPVAKFDDEEDAIARASLDLNDDAVLLDVVRDALDADRVDLFLQPIVSLPQRRTRFFKCEPRIRVEENIHLPPERYMPVAEREGLLAAIDNMLLFRAVQLVRRLRRRQNPVQFFCKISAETLNDRRFFMDFAGFMQDNRDLSSYLIFEMAQADVYKLTNQQQGELIKLAKIGFRFSMDQITNPDLFVSDLNAQGFRYVKIDADTLIRRMGRGDPRALKRGLDRGAIDLIVDDVDDEDRLIEVLDFAVDFGLGPLFGPPEPAELH
jgi:cyclic-di-GMP phosphodiesterase TipF (flagellum assembly factor)